MTTKTFAPALKRGRACLGVLMVAVAISALPSAAQPASRAGDARPVSDLDSAYTEILSQVVEGDGLVDYAALRGPLAADFRRVLRTVETFDAAALETQAARLAFWMNAYNIQMLQHIVESGPITNVIADGRDQTFFRTPVLTAGMAISLDEIEHMILRGPAESGPLAPFALRDTDARLHAGVNCAAVSCPRLRQRAFTARNVDDELDAGMREFVSSPRHFHIENGVLMASSLIDWYGEDFDRHDQAAGDWLLSFMDPDRSDARGIRERLKGRSSDDLRAADDVEFFYDWTLNDRALFN
ncbi:MAG: DUF547 domain-containing protein [Rhodothermales bacterium]|nr:DUF547 domain-containing protein [Rhodothermales bacterium]